MIFYNQRISEIKYIVTFVTPNHMWELKMRICNNNLSIRREIRRTNLKISMDNWMSNNCIIYQLHKSELFTQAKIKRKC